MILDILFITFILLPMTFFIHESGHCIFVKLLGGTITSISIGTGKKLFSIGKFHINKVYFYGGMFTYKSSIEYSKFKKSLILLGGVILNLIAFFIIDKVSTLTYYQLKPILLVSSQLNLYCAIFNLLPITINRINLDGKQLYQVIKSGISTLYDTK